MKVIELLKSKEWSGKVIDCVLRFALSFALAGAQVFGGYAPLALGMIGASGAGVRGVPPPARTRAQSAARSR